MRDQEQDDTQMTEFTHAEWKLLYWLGQFRSELFTSTTPAERFDY